MQDVVDASGHYPYQWDLKQINDCVPITVVPITDEWREVHTPLIVPQWQSHLQGHPDPEFVAYLLDGINHGFRIGFSYSNHTCRSAKRNMLSATQNPAVVEKYLAEECAKGRVIGPLAKGTGHLHINRFGVIPNPNQPGKWRLIVDLSYPEGASVNDGISSGLCSLSYASIDDAVSRIICSGKGTLLAKLDLENAYRMVPVHPEDRHLLGMEWDGKWYMDTALPFGLRSAPKIFTAMADGLIWIMFNRGVRAAIHYLDDYLFFWLSGVARVCPCLAHSTVTLQDPRCSRVELKD